MANRKICFLLILLLSLLHSQSLTLGALWPHSAAKSQNTGCIELEREALLKFMKTLTDPFHCLNSCVGKNCCNWVGVRCSKQTGNVIRLQRRGSDICSKAKKKLDMDPVRRQLLHLILIFWLNIVHGYCKCYLAMFLNIALRRRHMSRPLASIAYYEVSNNIASEVNLSSKKRRRHCDDFLIQVFGDVGAQLNEGIQLATDKIIRTVESISVDVDMNARRERLYADLKKVEGLTRHERHLAHITLLQDDHLLVGFPSIPSEEKVEWIRAIIH